MSNPTTATKFSDVLKKSIDVPLKTTDDLLKEQAVAKEAELRAVAAQVEASKPVGMTSAGVTEIEGRAPVTDTVVRPASRNEISFDPNILSEALVGEGVLVAKPLSMPESLNLRPVDPNIEFRWVNFKNEEGSRVFKFKSMGFEIAQVEDVAGSLPVDSAVNTIGITNYDVVLMKISKVRLLSAYEYNLQRSLANVSPAKAHLQAKVTAEGQLRKDMVAAGVPADYIKGRINYFTPTDEQADALNRS